jgi:hypothetical protein
MRSIDLRIPVLVGAAVVLLAVSPAKAQTANSEIIFVSGTGEAAASYAAPAPIAAAFANAFANAVGSAEADTTTDKAQADMLAIGDRLSDPQVQDSIAKMVGQMTERMLDLPVGKFAAAIEKALPDTMSGAIKGKKRIKANDTVADLAGRDADRLPAELAKGSKQMMSMMSGFATAFAAMMPEFEKLGKDMEKSFGDGKAKDRKAD